MTICVLLYSLLSAAGTTARSIATLPVPVIVPIASLRLIIISTLLPLVLTSQPGVARAEVAPNPQSVYAASKLLGEWFAQQARAYVLRVESLFGNAAPAPGADGRRAGGSLDRMADALLAGREVRAFVDRVVSPSHVDDIAAATAALLRAVLAQELYQCVGSGHATWFEVATALAGQQHLRHPRPERLRQLLVTLLPQQLDQRPQQLRQPLQITGDA